MAERGVEGARGLVLHRPGQGEAAIRYPAAWCREVDLVRGDAQDDVGVGAQVGEKIDLVLPAPLGGQVGGGGVGVIDDVDVEVLGPGMTVEAGAEHGAVLGPEVVGVGGGMDAEDAQGALLPCGVNGLFLRRGPRRLADGEEGEDADGGEAVGRDVGDVGDDSVVEVVHRRQLLQGRGGLAQDSVHAGRTIGVRGDLGDDEHLAGHGGECRAMAP
jgi:hypothetical protein